MSAVEGVGGRVHVLKIRLRHLRQRNSIIERRYRHISTIEDLRPGHIRIDARAMIKAPETRLSSTSCADGAGAETGSFLIAISTLYSFSHSRALAKNGRWWGWEREKGKYQVGKKQLYRKGRRGSRYRMLYRVS